jgi:hypothetical protein
MRGRIKRGSGIFQDHQFSRWPVCLTQTGRGEAEDQDMLFNIEWKGSYWECKAFGFGYEGEGYGCGSIFVSNIDGVDIIDSGGVS